MHISANNSILLFNPSSSGSGRRCVHDFRLEFFRTVINILIGYPANIMVLWLVARKEIDSSSDVFFVNLAIIDAFHSLFWPLNYLSIIILAESANFYTANFLFGMKDMSPLFLTCICLDRYLAVVHPVVFTRIKDHKIKVAFSMFFWPFMIGYSHLRAQSKFFSSRVYNAVMVTISLIMVFCNISIMWSLRRSVLGKEKINPMKKKALRTVQITLALIMFHYLPLAVLTPISYFIEIKTYCYINFMIYSIMELSCTTEPLLCISMVKQLSCLNNFPCICCRSPSPEPHNVRT